MQLWTFLHILSMFLAVTIGIGAVFWFSSAMRRRDLASLRGYAAISARADQVSGLFFVAGVISGLIAAVSGQWDLLRGWLVLAYVLLGALVIINGAAQSFVSRAKAAAASNEGDAFGDELEALARDPRVVAIPTINVVGLGLIIWDMVFKPAF